jgi:hypothetical protein
MKNPSSRQKESPIKKKSNFLDRNQNFVMSPGGAQRQDWLTD